MENITYEEFIQNILDTRGRFGCGDEYCERHHILPRCLGGDDDRDNLIDLFAKEHFIAHKLLSEENPDNDKLIYAYWMMAHIGRVEVSAEEYEDARIACSKALSEARQGWHVGEKNPNYGNYWTEEQKRRMSEINSNPSQETRDKMSAAGKRRMANPENNPMFGKHHTEEARKKQSKTRSINHICEKIVIQLTLDDEIVQIFWSAIQVERELSICCGDVSRCCNGIKLKSAGGCHWKYLYDNELRNGAMIPGAITLGLITEEEALKLLKQDKMIYEQEENV